MRNSKDFGQARMTKGDGYTLMELVVVIGVMVLIVGAGMGVFYQSLRSGSKVDFELSMDSASRVVQSSMVDVISYSNVVSVEGQDQDACLAAGSTGVTGDSLTVDIAGDLTLYSLLSNNIASASAGPTSVQINPEGISISLLSFNWVCVYGEAERLTVDFTAQAEKDDQDVAISRSYSFEMLLKNSGYY